MATRTKTFDCVEMKRQAQRKLRAEYESRKDEFDTYYDFLAAKADESELTKAIRAKIARAKANRS